MGEDKAVVDSRSQKLSFEESKDSISIHSWMDPAIESRYDNMPRRTRRIESPRSECILFALGRSSFTLDRGPRRCTNPFRRVHGQFPVYLSDVADKRRSARMIDARGTALPNRVARC